MARPNLPDTRSRILLVAAELFRERGYAGTSIRDVSERIGTTKAALYYHFRTKEEILAALVEPVLAAVDAFLDEMQARGAGPREIVTGLLDLMTAGGPGAAGNPGAGAASLRPLLDDPSIGSTERVGAIAARRRRLEQVLAGGADADTEALLRARAAVAAVEAIIEGVAELPDGSPTTMSTYRDLIIEVALTVLGPTTTGANGLR